MGDMHCRRYCSVLRIGVYASYSQLGFLWRPPRSLVSLQHAHELLVTGESVLRLKAFIWRYFMPIGVPDDPGEARAVMADARAMRAIIQLIGDKGRPIPSTLHADAVWIIRGDQVWTTKQLKRDVAS